MDEPDRHGAYIGIMHAVAKTALAEIEATGDAETEGGKCL